MKRGEATERRAMQAASGHPRGVRIYGLAPDGRAFLPLRALLSARWPTRSGSKGIRGGGRTQVFVAEL